MKPINKRNIILIIIGWVIVIVGLMINQWTLVLITKSGVIVHHTTYIVIWLFNIVCLITGYILIRKQHYIVNYYKEIVLIVISIIICIIIMDIGFRFISLSLNIIAGRDTIYSPELGWVMPPNVRSVCQAKGFGERNLFHH